MSRVLQPEQIAALSPSDYIEYFCCTLVDNDHVQQVTTPYTQAACTEYIKVHKSEIIDRLKAFAVAPALQAAAEKLPGLEAIRKARDYVYTYQVEPESHVWSVCRGDLDLMDNYSGDDMTQLYDTLKTAAAQKNNELKRKYPLTVMAETISKGINGNCAEVQYYRIKALEAVLNGDNYQEWLAKAEKERTNAL